tara:strand:- start:59 stop:244 length:186 start_codon:yes stop_codon:yes gene_type:complete
MSESLQRLEELGKQIAQERQIQTDLQNRFKESTERAVKINQELAVLAEEAANPDSANSGEA